MGRKAAANRAPRRSRTPAPDGSARARHRRPVRRPSEGPARRAACGDPARPAGTDGGTAAGIRPADPDGGGDADYALLDSGRGEKLERYGPLLVRRPENQAIWEPRDPARWQDADAEGPTGDTDEEGTGRWRFPKEPLGETWPLTYDGLSYQGRFTSFRHVGVFPEQAAHWSFAEDAIRKANRTRQTPVRLLNMFGYTGVASLVAGCGRADVTHVDASKKAIGWARENQETAGLGDKPVRWTARTRSAMPSARSSAAASTTRSCSIRRNSGAVPRARSGSSSRICRICCR